MNIMLKANNIYFPEIGNINKIFYPNSLTIEAKVEKMVFKILKIMIFLKV